MATRATNGDMAVRSAAEDMTRVGGEAEDGVALLAEAMEQTGGPLCGVERATEGCCMGEIAVEVSGVGCEDAHEATYGEGWSGWGLDVGAFKRAGEEEGEMSGRMEGDGLAEEERNGCDDGPNGSSARATSRARQARDRRAPSRHSRAASIFAILSSPPSNPPPRALTLNHLARPSQTQCLSCRGGYGTTRIYPDECPSHASCLHAACHCAPAMYHFDSDPASFSPRLLPDITSGPVAK